MPYNIFYAEISYDVYGLHTLYTMFYVEWISYVAEFCYYNRQNPLSKMNTPPCVYKLYYKYFVVEWHINKF